MTMSKECAVGRIKLHQKGPEFSRIVYGTWRLGDKPEERCPKIVLARIKECLSLGITTFDLADIYGGYTYEKLFGEALALEPELRQRMELVGKCGIVIECKEKPGVYVKHYDTSKKYIIESTERSLRLVGVVCMDLLLIHRPDPLMDAREVADAFIALKESGKVKFFGTSNFSVSQFELLQSFLPFPLVTNQIEVSCLEMKSLCDGTLDFFQKQGVSPMAWSPVGGGRLFSLTLDAQSQRLVDALKKVAQFFGPEVSIDQIAYAWLLAHPSKMLPICGTNSIDRIKSIAKSEDFKLDRQQWFSIWKASAGNDVP